MNFGKTGDRTHTLDGARHLAGTVLSIVHLLNSLWHTIKTKASIFLPLVSILALAAGVGLGAVSETLSNAVYRAASTLIDGYAMFAPLLIFMVLAPVLSRIFSTKERGKFGIYTVGWIAVAKLIASMWAVLFTAAIFSFPVLPEGSASIGQAFAITLSSLLSTLTQSQFFWAIYASIVIGLIAMKFKVLGRLLEKGVTSIEYVGQYMAPLVLIFMLAVGVYIQSLPANLVDQIGIGGTGTVFQSVSIFGITIDPNTASGMVTAYIMGSLLVAIACFAFHFGVLAWTKYRAKRFSVINYFKHYWLRAYPLLWSTSSESLATPLSLYILKKYAPYVRPTVRRLVGGAAATLCTQGTLICVFVLIGLVASMLGIHLSLFELLLCIPVAFFISFGIPGIPGELLLFAGPLSLILGISPAVLPLFLALYLGLQLGLPDSFRTGGNMTDSYLFCILLNEVYEKRFRAEEPKGEE